MSLSRLDQRGASRSSRTLRRDAVGASMLQRGLAMPTNSIDAHGQVAWSWHPDADVKLATTLTRRAGDGDQKARSTGENAKQLLKPSRGECRAVSAEPVVPAACIFCCRRAMGAASARHSPCPLSSRGRVHRQTSDAKIAPRDRKRASVRKRLSERHHGADQSPVVIAREGGRSSTPRCLGRSSLPLEYWIARTSRAMTREQAVGVILTNQSPQNAVRFGTEHGSVLHHWHN